MLVRITQPTSTAVSEKQKTVLKLFLTQETGNFAFIKDKSWPQKQLSPSSARPYFITTLSLQFNATFLGWDLHLN